MVIADIAFDTLRRDQLARLDELISILDEHPDKAAFRVATDGATGDERKRRLFEECARWPDDARGTIYDQPTWHYFAKPLLRGVGSPGFLNAPVGSAPEAFALNL